MRRIVRHALGVFLLASLVGGCEPATPENVQLVELQDRLLTPRCAHPACHGGDTPARDLDLTEGRAFDALINVPSRSVSGAIRVVPGRPEESLLYQVTETGIDGRVRRMPLGSTLSAYERELLRVWIEEGCN